MEEEDEEFQLALVVSACEAAELKEEQRHQERQDQEIRIICTICESESVSHTNQCGHELCESCLDKPILGDLPCPLL